MTPKDTGGDEKGDVKGPNELTSDLIREILEDKNLRSMIFNLDEIKNKIDSDSKGPY